VASPAQFEDRTAGLALRLEGVGKSFTTDAGRTVTALENVDLAVRRGEFVTVVGPTGCGKTTLLNIIAGLDPPDRGTVRLAREISRGRNLAYVFQHYTLFPWRTVLANVAFAQEMDGKPRAARRCLARSLVARVGLAGFENSYPHELSGGMRQRVAIAQALAMEPRLFLMDEPFGALDEATRAGLQKMLTDLQRDTGVTVVFVTHNIDEAIILGDRVVAFSGRPGSAAGEFTVDLARPRNPEAPGFVDLMLEIRYLLGKEFGSLSENGGIPHEEP